MTDSNFIIKKGLDVFDGDVSLKGSNKELRFYEGSNYVGFEAPALSADKIWVLPNADGSTGQVLKTDGSGNLGWATAGDATLAGTQTFSGAKTFTSDVNLDGAGLNINKQYSRINFKKDATNNAVNNAAIFFYNASDSIRGGINYMYSLDRLGFNAGADYQLYITDGAIYPPVDNDVDLGTSSLKFKDSFFGLVDAENFKVNGGQGSDGQVLTSTGSGVAWEDAGGGGASAIDDLSDAITTATSNIGLGSGALDSLTASSGNYNVALGINAGTAITVGDGNCLIGFESGKAITNKDQNTLVGYQAGLTLNDYQNTLIGYQAGKALVGHAQNTFVGAGTGVGATSDQAVSVGYGSMFQYSGTGGIAIGYQAGLALTSANYPIFIGYMAGWSASTGARNIGVGYQALKSVGSSSDNIAIGYDALSGVISSGNYNVGIGNYTLDALTTADNNVAIGHSAGSSLTTQGSNVMIGWEAGKSSTSTQSTYVGYYAGINNLSNYNVAIGAEAMMTYGDKTAERNVAIGNAALKVIETGDRNTAVGAYNGLAVTTGSDNIFLGYQAGDNITTGSNNVVIGAADVSSATGSDQLSISSGDGGTTWITGDSDGNVKGTDFYMHAEWNDQYFTDTLRNGKRFSFGAGMNNNTNSDSGTIGTETILPRACTLEEMHFWIGNVGAETGSGNFTVRIDKNGTELTTAYTFNMSGSGGNHVQKSFTPNVSFDSGETFNLTLHDAATSGYGSENQIGRIRVTFRFRTNN